MENGFFVGLQSHDGKTKKAIRNQDHKLVMMDRLAAEELKAMIMAPEGFEVVIKHVTEVLMDFDGEWK